LGGAGRCRVATTTEILFAFLRLLAGLSIIKWG